MLGDILIQGVGFLAMGMGIVSFQFNKRKTLLIIQTVMSLTWAAHFLLLHELTGAMLNIFGALRCFVYSNRDKKWASYKIIPYIFSAVFIAVSLATYDGWKSLLPMVAMVTTSFACWSEDTSLLRKLNLPCNVLWFTYDALSSSWAGVANEIFVVTSIVVAMVRFDRKKDTEKD